MKYFYFFLVAFLFASCSSNDEPVTDIPGGENSSTKLIKSEAINDDWQIGYQYNEEGLLVEIVDDYDADDSYITKTITYGPNENITRLHSESRSGEFESTTDFYYDTENRLSSTEEESTNSNGTRTTNFSYDNNIVTVHTESAQSDNLKTLEINSAGLVTKLEEGEKYSTFEYDSNGNLISIQTFDQNSELLYSHSYSFDDRINPFYGQLESLYLPIFIDVMDDLSYGEIIVYQDDGYQFPFLRNNIKQIESNTENSWVSEYSYEYEGEYPTYGEESTDGEVEYSITYEYY